MTRTALAQSPPDQISAAEGPSALIRRLRAPGPKRILSLDGGGTRGIISLAFLERIEAVLCGDHPDTRLADHFDLIGGTSTGAIIASALSLGWTVAELRDVYCSFARSVFRRRWYRIAPIFNRYDARALEALLRVHFGHDADGSDLLLGGPELRTGLAVVSKRVDTASPWVVSNLPWAPFYADRGGPNGNWRIPLRNLVRASTAAPTFFRPVELPLGPRADGSTETGRFVDGGTSPYNNPALRLLELARLRCFGLNWQPGKDHLMVVSIGTGHFRVRHNLAPVSRRQMRSWPMALGQHVVLLQAVSVLQGIIGDGVTHTVRSLQALGHCPQPVLVDSEVGDMRGEALGAEPLFTALRYDLDLDGLPQLGTDELRTLRRLDGPDRMERLWELGQAAAARDVVADHLLFQPEGDPGSEKRSAEIAS